MEEINLLTLQLAKKYTDEHGGGGGGTSNYNDLSHKPQINSTTLEGNLSLSDLGIASATSVSAITDGQSIDSFADVESALADKVDKVAGYGLSENDYTDADKAIVGGVTAALESKADASAVKNEFLGTLEEWNALTTAEKKAYDTYQITNDFTGGSGLPNYSTTEQKTGQKWVDGKDIYSKTIDIGTLPNNNYVEVNHGITGIGKVVKIELFAYADLGVSMVESGIFYANFVDSTKIRVTTTFVAASYTAKATIFYTKATT